MRDYLFDEPLMPLLKAMHRLKEQELETLPLKAVDESSHDQDNETIEQTLSTF